MNTENIIIEETPAGAKIFIEEIQTNKKGVSLRITNAPANIPVSYILRAY